MTTNTRSDREVVARRASTAAAVGTAIEYFGLGETKVDLDDDITEEPVG